MVNGSQWGALCWIGKRADTDQVTMFHTPAKEDVGKSKTKSELLTHKGILYLLGVPMHSNTLDDNTEFKWIDQPSDNLPTYYRREQTPVERFAHAGAIALTGPCHVGSLSSKNQIKKSTSRIWPGKILTDVVQLLIRDVVEGVTAVPACANYKPLSDEELYRACYESRRVSNNMQRSNHSDDNIHFLFE